MKNMLLRFSALFGIAAIAAGFVGVSDAKADWSGPYVGVTLSSVQNDWDVDLTTSTDGGMYEPVEVGPVGDLGSGSFSDDTVSGGLEAGYNWQSGNWVFGVEGDFTFIDGSDRETRTGYPFDLAGPTFYATFDQEVSVDWLSTVRGRVGYDFGPALIFATAGVAFGKVEFSSTEVEYAPNGSGDGNSTASGDDTATGWAAGLGAEHRINDRWSIKGEYLHVELDSVDATGIVTTGSSNTATHEFETDYSSDIFRLGLNFSF